MAFLMAIILSLISQKITALYLNQPFHLSFSFFILSVIVLFNYQQFQYPYFYLLFASWLLTLAYMDYQSYTFSGYLFYSGALFLCLYVIFKWQITLVIRLLSALFFFILLSLLNILVHGMGQGDIELIAVLAFLFGYQTTCLIIFFSCLFGLMQRKEKLPFVPCIACSSLLVIYCQIML